MKSFRNPKYLERYEDFVFDLEQALVVPATATTLAANATQARNITSDLLLITQMK